MDILRRNTDYALRAMVNLARHYGNESVSTRRISHEEEFPYQFACKLMQRLNKAKLVESSMGPSGGFRLSREPAKITLLEVIGVMQGNVSLSRCLLRVNNCSCKNRCGVRRKLVELQGYIENFLGNITLDELVNS